MRPTHGKSADDYKAALSASAKTKFDEKVASGDLTQERADKWLAKFNESLDKVINYKPDPDNVAKCRERMAGDDDQDDGASPSPAPEGTGA